MTIADQVRSVIAQHLGIALDTVTDEAHFRDDLGADSLDAFELLMAFEETFGIEIPARRQTQCSASATPSPTSKRKSPRAAHAGGVIW